MQIGWIQDTHTTQRASDPKSGAQQGLVEDYNYLTNTIGVDHIYHGGDVCYPDRDVTGVPNTPPAAYDRFFSLIDQTDDPSALKRLVPGNHDVPLTTFLKADERCVLRDRIDHPGANLSVLFINTYANSHSMGSPGVGTHGGAGSELTRMAKADVEWMDQQLAEINTAGNAALIVPHAALTFIPSANYSRVNGKFGQNNAETLYNVIVNHRETHGVLADHASSGLDIVVPVSHLFQFSDEGSEAVDGVHYVYKKHYYRGSDDGLYTFAHIDMSGTGATVTTVDHGTKNETAVLDVTF